MINALYDHELFRASPLFSIFNETPIRFVDVGARDGVHELVEPIAGCVDVLGFEADADEAQRISEEMSAEASPWHDVIIHGAALAGVEGAAKLYEAAAPSNSSLRPTNSILNARYGLVKWEITAEHDLNTKTLDAVVSDADGARWGDFIKLDTQGTEYEILEGSFETLKNAALVVCEVAFLELYEGQKLFSDVEKLLRQNGLLFYGWGREYKRSTGRADKSIGLVKERAWQADAVFIRDPFDKAPDVQLADRDVAKLVLAGLLTRYFDFSLEVVERTRPEWLDTTKALVAHLSAIHSDALSAEITNMAQRPTENGVLNVARGKFVDKYREYTDYGDYSDDGKKTVITVSEE